MRLAVLVTMLLAGGVVLAAAASGDDANAAEPFDATKRCPRGFVHASIAGRHRCLRVGQRCNRRWDRAYHRNGFHCHTGRLVRKRRPAPPPPPPPPPARDLGPPGAPGCQPPSPAQAWGNGLVEAKGTAAAGEMWVLLFQGVWTRGGNATFTGAVGRPFKIVWRMTGRGPLRVAFTAPTGRARPLAFGPEAHSASSYHRPGDEWGTGFVFDEPGCWHIRLQRTSGSGDVWFDVADA